MTLDEAVRVLNEHRHREIREWRVMAASTGPCPCLFAVGPDHHDHSLEGWEAIVIAEAYRAGRRPSDYAPSLDDLALARPETP